MLTDGAAHVLRTLYVPRWPSDSTKSSPEVAWAVEAAFSLKKGTQLSNFIIEDNLKASRLALGEDPQVALTTGPFITTPPPTISVSIEVIASPTSGFRVIYFAIFLSSLLIALLFCLSFLCSN